MKTLPQNNERELEKYWLIFETSFIKPLVAQFTLQPLSNCFVSLFAVAARLINVIA